MSRRFLAATVLAPVLAQCQGHIEALRYAAFVPFSGTMEVWHNPGYETDELWFPSEGVRCIALRKSGDGSPSDGATPWFVHADAQPPFDAMVGEPVRVPPALAARIFALAGQADPAERERRELAEEGCKAGLFRTGMTDLERALGTWR
jgi:hypothetical protein